MHGFAIILPLALSSLVHGVPMFQRAAGTALKLVNVTTPVTKSGSTFQVLDLNVVDQNLAIEIACANDQATCVAAGTDSRICALNVGDCEANNNIDKVEATLNNDPEGDEDDQSPPGCQTDAFGTFCNNNGNINSGSLKTTVSGAGGDGALFTVQNLTFPERDVALQVGCLIDEKNCNAAGSGASACDAARVKCEQDNDIAGESVKLVRSGIANGVDGLPF